MLQHSHHAFTLRPVTRAALGEAMPAPGRINSSQYAFVEKNGRFYFEINPPSMPKNYQLWPLDFVFGSASTGITFVSMLEGRNVVEMKMSYFPHKHKWGITPGQKFTNPAAAGNLANLVQSRQCLGCHMVAMSKNTFVPRQEFYGVGCESCHGPGRQHIAAVQSGSHDLKMVDLKRLDATGLNTLCGKCHETAKEVGASPFMRKMTYRFQPYGLMKSRCFLESGNRLSCESCHDPHTNASSDMAVYVRACLSCHSGSQIGSPAVRTLGQGKTCPVNPKGNCIPCHMPQRDVLSALNERYGFSMTEHLIGIDRADTSLQ